MSPSVLGCFASGGSVASESERRLRFFGPLFRDFVGDSMIGFGWSCWVEERVARAIEKGGLGRWEQRREARRECGWFNLWNENEDDPNASLLDASRGLARENQTRNQTGRRLPPKWSSPNSPLPPPHDKSFPRLQCFRLRYPSFVLPCARLHTTVLDTVSDNHTLRAHCDR